MLKTCTKCSVSQELTHYYTNPACKDGHEHQCKSCRLEQRRKRYNPEAERERNYQKKYGISTEVYDHMYELQQGKCAICSTHWEQLHVDHDHETGKVRELLCISCNVLLGHAKDNPELLTNAINYITSHA